MKKPRGPISLRAALVSLPGNAALAARRPALFASLAAKAAGSRAAFARLVRLSADAAAVRRSPLFDADWLRREHPEWASSGLPAELSYLLQDAPDGRFSSRSFSADAWLERHPDARKAGWNGLVHRILSGPDEAETRGGTPAERRAAALRRVRAKAARGEPLRAVFTASSAAMFPARPLFAEMLGDPAFDARIAVVPDLRWPGRDPALDMEACARELGAAFPGRLLPLPEPDAEGRRPDLLADADLVVFHSPYDISDFRFNPSRSDAGLFVSVHVNYGYYRSVYDRSVLARENYARFWKVFAECDATMDEIRRFAAGGGSNAETVGYVKMDALATCRPAPKRPGRKLVVLAPHHSVEGGANDALGLSNFERFADFFLSLPEKFPEMDFAMRPHPFLFRQLSSPRRWGEVKTEAWKRRFLARENASWSEGGDYFPLFAAADAIVQDCGSYLVEWFYVGKPCCYMLKSKADLAKFAPLGRECLARCDVVFDESGIVRFLRERVAEGRDPGKEERDAFRRRVMVNHPHAAAAALAALRRGLGLPARA